MSFCAEGDLVWNVGVESGVHPAADLACAPRLVKYQGWVMRPFVQTNARMI